MLPQLISQKKPCNYMKIALSLWYLIPLFSESGLFHGGCIKKLKRLYAPLALNLQVNFVINRATLIVRGHAKMNSLQEAVYEL
jgi:prepilin signal peptidase PulO-like enzyme (type II secretory pathway)